jgi:hypothetical protein
MSPQELGLLRCTLGLNHSEGFKPLRMNITQVFVMHSAWLDHKLPSHQLLLLLMLSEATQGHSLLRSSAARQARQQHIYKSWLCYCIQKETKGTETRISSSVLLIHICHLKGTILPSLISLLSKIGIL